MPEHATQQQGSRLIHSLVVKFIALHAQNKPGFGVGFGGAGRVGTALIMYSQL